MGSVLRGFWEKLRLARAVEDGWEWGGKMGPPGGGCSWGEGWESQHMGGDENPRAPGVWKGEQGPWEVSPVSSSPLPCP